VSGWYVAALIALALGLGLDIAIGVTARQATDDIGGLVGIVIVTLLFGGVGALLALIGVAVRFL